MLRAMVVNGPERHPGANFVSDADGRLISLHRRSRAQRVAISKTLLAADGLASDHVRTNAFVSGVQLRQKTVGRHLCNGRYPA